MAIEPPWVGVHPMHGGERLENLLEMRLDFNDCGERQSGDCHCGLAAGVNGFKRKNWQKTRKIFQKNKNIFWIEFSSIIL